MQPSDAALPQDLIDRLRRVRSVGAITGAGVSRESGIQTYRGQGGLYDDPEEGDRTVEALSAPTLAGDPDRTWRVVAELARQAGAAEPSAAHRALVEIENKVERFVLLTQNVDGLHGLAGSRNVIEIHGDIFATRCMQCADAARLDRSTLETLLETPRCPACRGPLRPDVVLFGELIPPDRYQQICDGFHLRVPNLVLVIGTSALFPYITDPVWIAKQAGKLTVEINPEPTPLSDVVDYSLRGTAGSYLPLIERAL